MDAYGTMGSWFIFHHVKENNTKINDLEKRFYALKRQLEDLTTENTKLKSRVKSLSGKLEKSNKPLLEN
jgi:regulator of replication initiation timing